MTTDNIVIATIAGATETTTDGIAITTMTDSLRIKNLKQLTHQQTCHREM
ncbi:MAG: hypothetical protein JO235_24925 [Chroococcidiopsidaceae cyanobacterium CP_BM_RX_35]|nr:hypothetical protein [Chroococcidiopsidaceae cyanobacterium CP_BM_RX_35]